MASLRKQPLNIPLKHCGPWSEMADDRVYAAADLLLAALTTNPRIPCNIPR